MTDNRFAKTQMAGSDPDRLGRTGAFIPDQDPFIRKDNSEIIITAAYADAGPAAFQICPFYRNRRKTLEGCYIFNESLKKHVLIRLPRLKTGIFQSLHHRRHTEKRQIRENFPQLSPLLL